MLTEDSNDEIIEKETKPKLPRDEPILKFIGPEGASKIIVLMAALFIILQGNTAFWDLGVNASPDPNGTAIFSGIMLYILGIILILMIGMIGFGTTLLKKIEIIEKYYSPIVLILMAVIVLIFEALYGSSIPSPPLATTIGVLLGAILLFIAVILELPKEKQIMKPSKLVCLVGVVIAIVEAFTLFITEPIEFSNYWDGIIALIVAVLLLLSMYEKIFFIPYEWWMVLILGFILYGWVTPSGSSVGGTLVLISFVLMLIEK